MSDARAERLVRLFRSHEHLLTDLGVRPAAGEVFGLRVGVEAPAAAARVSELVSPIGDIANEAQARESVLRIVTLDEFADVDEPGASALLGSEDEALIPEGANVMVYGDGGTGKTTLCVDLACHLAAGDDWLGIAVPSPLRVLIVENEGPRSLFRRKLRRKRDGWPGSPLGGRLEVVEQPWAAFTFSDPGWRQALADELRSREVNVLIVGPVVSSGMDTAGTLQEVRAFLALVDQVRALCGRPIAIVLVHHESKGGKVSGAWEGAGDTLLHVMQQGPERLRLYVQKARWASGQHATTMQLAWADGDGFRLADEPPARPERTWDDIENFVLVNGGTAWGKVCAAVSGQADYLARRRDQMLADGLLLNAGTPSRMSLWHRDDPARPTLNPTDSEGGIGRESVDSTTGDGEGRRTDSPIPVRSRESGRESVVSASPGEPEQAA